MSDRLQHERYELKYLVHEEQTPRIRDFIRSYLQVDEYGEGQPNFSYPTLSLYLDSDRLDTYWYTINGNKNRFKLRLRYYDDRPNTPVFFEIKRRDNNVILKERGGVKKSAVPLLLAGQMPEHKHLLRPDDEEQFVAVQRFCQLMQTLHARPKMHVAYMREAYENPDNNAVRLTFDRFVESAPLPLPNLIARSDHPHSVFGKTVILELKFTSRFPKWFRELVETFNLMQAGAAKFAEGIFTKGEDWVYRVCKPTPPEIIVQEFLSAEGYPGLFESAKGVKA
ncbi:MAG TPA: polyphosphate polymerase domain-containing protein [Candidatus Nitrosotalea sp.]|nr:polyphosphate polymerase domain-containing protein [Candidatus Nitrosotalea sp.]